MTNLTHAHLQTVVEPQLERLGFRRCGDGLYRLDGFDLRCDDHWLTLECEHSDTSGRESNGLWREVNTRTGKKRLVFDLPVDACVTGPPGETPETPNDDVRLTACLEWALTTGRNGTLPLAAPPPLEVIENHLHGASTTVRVGDIVRECAIERTADRLALTCPLVLFVPENLPATRQDWLARLITRTQDLWRLVRVGRHGSAVLACVDLTGTPPAALPGLLHDSLASLRGSVAWAAQAAAFIVSDIESSILDHPFPGDSEPVK